MAETKMASRDRDETEMVTTFVETRPRRYFGMSGDRDHNIDCVCSHLIIAFIWLFLYHL